MKKTILIIIACFVALVIIQKVTPKTTTPIVKKPVVATKCTPREIHSFSDGRDHVSMGIPRLEITSPKAGDHYIPGDTITVKWAACSSSDATEVAVILNNPSGNSITLGHNIPIQSGQYSYIIPTNQLNSRYDYTITVTDGMLSDSNFGGDTTGKFAIAYPVM